MKNLPSLKDRREEIKRKVLSKIRREIILFNLVDEGYKEEEVIRLLTDIDEELRKKSYMGVFEITVSCFLFMIGFLSQLAFPILWWQGAVVEIALFVLIYWVTSSPVFESKIPKNYWIAFYSGRFVAGLAEAAYLWRFNNP
ncbi:Uncharacterised protein [uncultured archaeon]|nr:Uncharacterised protein [uncultured archaeon]